MLDIPRLGYAPEGPGTVGWMVVGCTGCVVKCAGSALFGTVSDIPRLGYAREASGTVVGMVVGSAGCLVKCVGASSQSNQNRHLGHSCHLKPGILGSSLV